MVDITITPANVVGGSNSSRDYGTAGEAITAGQAVYLSATTNKWMLADNNSATAAARKAQAMAVSREDRDEETQVMRAEKLDAMNDRLDRIAAGICRKHPERHSSDQNPGREERSVTARDEAGT